MKITVTLPDGTNAIVVQDRDNETTLKAWALNDKLTAEAAATPLANDDMGREFHGIDYI